MEGNPGIQVRLTQTGVNYGDHAQDVVTLYEVGEGETVQELVDRLLGRDHLRFNPETQTHEYVRVPRDWDSRIDLMLVMPFGWKPVPDEVPF